MALNKSSFVIRFSREPSDGSEDTVTPGLGLSLVTDLRGAKTYSLSKGLGLMSKLTIEFKVVEPEPPDPEPGTRRVTIPDYDSGVVVFPIIRESAVTFTIETITERVQFFLGEGTVRYPPVMLLNVVWESQSLGEVTFEGLQLIAPTLLDSVALVTYQTSSLDM